VSRCEAPAAAAHLNQSERLIDWAIKMNDLSQAEWLRLIRVVFPVLEQDRALGIIVDLPKQAEEDNPAWRRRPRLAAGWHAMLAPQATELGLQEVALLAYENVGLNNADLPATWLRVAAALPETSETLSQYGELQEAEQIFRRFQLFLAPTEHSATAPLKVNGKKYGFRAATMPGFRADMIPALRVDYQQVFQRLLTLKEKLDNAERAEIVFAVDHRRECSMVFDLRHRQATVSSGRFFKAGEVGNLPSGETYIVPYEGEKEEPSATEGILPVQVGDSLLYYTIKRNRARSVAGEGEAVRQEADRLVQEPAYGNMAELGFGVLADFGITPIGEILLDEKLGFHVGFGRSDHFGGFVGAGQFSAPARMVHLDRIYVPACQPRVSVQELALIYADGRRERMIHRDRYTVFAGPMADPA